MGHTFYLGSEEILYLEPSGEYDTATPYKFCSNTLFGINKRIKAGQIIRIISEVDDTGPSTFVIQTPEDFRRWAKNIFKGGFEEYLETGI